MSVSEDFMRVLKDAKLSSTQPEGGWMKRSEIVAQVYGKGMPVNEHHRTIFMRLEASGLIEERVSTKGHLSWFEYRSL